MKVVNSKIYGNGQHRLFSSLKIEIYSEVNLKNGTAEVNLKESETGISPGQACVFYSKNQFGDKVLGGGWITRTINKYLST